jgi:hypothetical protein
MSPQNQREFELLMFSQGFRVPEDRKDGAFAAYEELRRIADQLRGPRGPEVEPANVFNLLSILRQESESND